MGNFYRCADCGRSNFDDKGACEYCGLIDYAVADEMEAKKK